MPAWMLCIWGRDMSLAKTKRVIKNVVFFGDAEAKTNDSHYKLALETAKILAKAGYVVVNGGGPGVMYAATAGAKEVGGRVGAVVIDGRIDMGENFEGQYKKNIDKTSFKIVRKNYLERLRALMEEGDAYVIFNGGTGTISEIGEVWAEAKFNFGNHKPIIFVGDFWKDILEPIVNYMRIDTQETSVYEIVDSPEEVYQVLQKVSSEQN